MTPRIGSEDSATRLTHVESRGFARPPRDGYAFSFLAKLYALTKIASTTLGEYLSPTCAVTAKD